MAIVPDQGGHVNASERPELPIELQRQILGSLCDPYFRGALFFILEPMIKDKILEILREKGKT